MGDGYDSDRNNFRVVDDYVVWKSGDGPKSDREFRHVRSPGSDLRISGKQSEGVYDLLLDMVRRFWRIGGPCTTKYPPGPAWLLVQAGKPRSSMRLHSFSSSAPECLDQIVS